MGLEIIYRKNNNFKMTYDLLFWASVYENFHTLEKLLNI